MNFFQKAHKGHGEGVADNIQTFRFIYFGLERQKYEKSLLVLHCYVMSNVLALWYYDASVLNGLRMCVC